MDEFLQTMGVQWQTILILALSFIFLILLLSRVLFRPLLKYLDDRNREIKNTFTEIEKSKQEITRLKEEYQAELAGIEKAAYEKTQEAIKAGLVAKSEIITEAHTQSSNILRKATEEIEQEKKKALAELKAEIVNLSLSAAGRIIEEKLDDQTNRKMVERFLADLKTTREHSS